MSETPNFSSVELESAIAAAGEKFTLTAVLKALGVPRSDTVRRRLERIIESDPEYFYNSKFQCITRRSFFNRREFIITPDEWEINEGVLFPGHRFIPFIPENVFPSDVKLFSGETNFGKRKLTLPLGQIFHYHLLLGSEQIFDFLIAEDPANAHLSNRVSSTEQVTLEAFDLSGFYREHDFAAGDALLCRIEDYENGRISCVFLPATARQNSDRKARVQALDQAIKQVWDNFGDYPDIPEQLAWAEFFAGQQSFATGASLDEFISASTMVELRADGDHAVLSIRQENKADTDDFSLPPGLSISENSLDDPMKLLSGSGAALSEAELDGFMLDAIYKRESDFDGVYSRIFGHRELDLEDEAQQAVLLNYLEERFENLQENYNRADDEPKAGLRSDIIEAVEDRLEYLAYLGSLDRDINEKERDILNQLADISAKIGEVLKLLNSPAFTPDSIELEHLSELVNNKLDEQDEMLGHLCPDDERL